MSRSACPYHPFRAVHIMTEAAGLDCRRSAMIDRCGCNRVGFGSIPEPPIGAWIGTCVNDAGCV